LHIFPPVAAANFVVDFVPMKCAMEVRANFCQCFDESTFVVVYSIVVHGLLKYGN